MVRGLLCEAGAGVYAFICMCVLIHQLAINLCCLFHDIVPC